MYKVKVNEQFQFDIEIEKNNLKINGEEIFIDSAALDNGTAHLLYKHQSYNAEVISIDKAAKTCQVKVNGTVYSVGVEDQYDQLLQQLGLDTLVSNKITEIKAPMPGLVLNVMVAEDAEVKKGDSLLILEAMKMENILKSSTDGIVKKIAVIKGDKVEKNQILIQFK
ncbi:biotin/lipoyl-binding protein [Pedobacter sp. G11]|uniref:acetyl-CoA carboxylase biotin carboxyl carrier protein subunit n=1 Tax=Pedobacter sp. G11 TaxID=2482728 RepID=UPI000F5FA18F|nr:acetyl-CoA carboxylase biotin carboxyl carrier protein subunit [Pedobacter sp. G11]AZI25092.1 biotin/lipoyl-binding protein [Pedobacter sp. G11]